MRGQRSQLLRVVLNNALKALTVAVPLLGPLVVRVPALAWLKDEVLRAAVSLAIVAAILFFEGRDVYVTQIRSKDFRDEYMKEVTKPLAPMIGFDLRFNVMYARRRFWMLWLGHAFEWDDDPLGFVPGRFHYDQTLLLTEWQGVCGLAFRTHSVAFQELAPMARGSRWPWLNPFGLFRSQLRATQHVRAVLSVPMFLKRKGRKPHPVGVINVDAVSDAGVAYLKAEWEKWKATGGGDVVPKLLGAGSLIAVVR